MIGEHYAPNTLILDMFKTSVVGSQQTRIRVEAYKERGRRSTIVPAAGKVGGEVFFIN